MRRVVITGMGAVTPIGNSVAELWESVQAGKCGIAPITHYDASARKVTLAAELKDFHPENVVDKRELRRIDPFITYALYAAHEAVEDAAFDLEKLDKMRCGVIVSSGIGGLQSIQEEDLHCIDKGYDRCSPYFVPKSISNMAAGRIAIDYGFHGMCSCVVTACAGGTNAIGEAFRYIRDGYGDLMLCGGTEAAINPLGVGGFTTLTALSNSKDPLRASIPFDKERSGFVIGEGAGILVLEEYEHAKARGAKIYCEVVGYGANCDAYHITAPMPDGSMAAYCMKQAMDDAKISPADVDYINAHGTSTPMNDKSETKAVRMAFGEAADHVMISSTKSMMGHLLGAAGAVEGIITALSVQNDFVPATIGYQVPDPECDLDIVPNEGRHTKVRYAMSNSLGFGGHNATVVFKKIEED